MKKIEIKPGEIFNYWTVLEESKNKNLKGEIFYKVQCKCGVIKDVRGYSLRNNISKSCGCLVKEYMSKSKRIDIKNQKFGRLTAIERIVNEKGHFNNWLCKCDCGNEVVVSTGTLRRNKQQSCGCIRQGEENHRWKGGKIITQAGYVKKYSPLHPNNINHYVLEHRLVMEEFLGRPLEKNEEVHHKNGIRNDNRLENLELWVKSQPPGQRVDDLINFSYNFIKKYKPEFLKDEFK